MDNDINLTNKQLGAFGLTADQFQKNLKKVQSGRTDTPLDPTKVSGSTQPELAETPVFTAGDQLRTSIGSSTERFGQKASEGTLTAEDIQAENQGMIARGIEALKGKEEIAGEKAGRKAELREEQDTVGLIESAKDFRNQLEAEQLALRDAKDAVFSEGGLTKAQAQARIGEMEKVSLSKQARIAILGNAAQGNLQAARDIIAETLENEFGEEEARLDAQITQINALRPLIGDVANDLEKKANDEKNAIKEEMGYKSDIMSLALEFQKAGRNDIANQLMSQTTGEVTAQDVLDAQALVVTSGISVAGDTTNPGGYTDQELRKLRNAGIDPTNTGRADDLLYGSKLPQITSEGAWNKLRADVATIGIDTDKTYSTGSGKEKEALGVMDIANRIRSEGKIALSNGTSYRLTPTQSDVIALALEASTEEGKTVLTGELQNPFGGGGLFSVFGNAWDGAAGVLDSFFR